ncbi:frequency clock protein-domain-containing protein [Fusarium oxysporum]|nr:frequency clock protein-domain-containing protein [Fusarium oxysporum]
MLAGGKSLRMPFYLPVLPLTKSSKGKLYLINITPDFVYSAILKISTRFQLSTNRHKIRWQGGSKDTKFSSHISIYNSQESPPANDINGSEKTREHQKTSPFISNKSQSGGLNKNISTFNPQFYTYIKNINTSQDISVYSPIAIDDDNPTSKLQYCKGIIIYYSNIPFCTNLLDRGQGLHPGLINNDFIDTKRPKQDILPQASKPQTRRPNENIEGTIDQRAATLTLCPIPGGSETKVTEQSPSIEIKYLSGHIKRLTPVPLPAPAMFFPPFSVNNSTSVEYDELSIDVNTGS